jgi:hypothetical protein
MSIPGRLHPPLRRDAVTANGDNLGDSRPECRLDHGKRLAPLNLYGIMEQRRYGRVFVACAHGHEMGDIGDNIVFAGLGPEQAFRERKRSGKSISQNYRLLNPEVASALHRAELDHHRAAAADRRPPCSLLGLSKTAGAGLLDVRGSSFIPVLPARTSAAVLHPTAAMVLL